jgi:PhnB protein
MNGVMPYITFQGNCEEALNFYQECLGGEILYMGRYGGSPMAGQAPDDKIMHATLKVGDTHIMAADNMAPDPFAVGGNIALTVGTEDAGDAERIFNALAEGGRVTMPIAETFWAERFGMLTDKFGIDWMVNCEKAADEMEKKTAA